MKTYGFNAPNQYGFGSDQGLGFVGSEAVPVVPVAPNAPTNFTASDDEYDQITFTWDNSTIGTPTPTYEIMIDGGATIASGVTSPHTESIAVGTEDYKVRATNSEGFADSNIDGGTSLADTTAPIYLMTEPLVATGVLDGHGDEIYALNNSASSGELFDADLFHTGNGSKSNTRAWIPNATQYPEDGTIDMSFQGNGFGSIEARTNWIAPQDEEWTMSGIYNVVMGVSYDMYSIHYKGNQTCDIYLGSDTVPLALSESDKAYTPPLTEWIIEEEPPVIIIHEEGLTARDAIVFYEWDMSNITGNVITNKGTGGATNDGLFTNQFGADFTPTITEIPGDGTVIFDTGSSPFKIDTQYDMPEAWTCEFSLTIDATNGFQVEGKWAEIGMGVRPDLFKTYTLYDGSASSSSATYDNSLTSGDFIHCVFSRQADGSIDSYVNGVLINTTASSPFVAAARMYYGYVSGLTSYALHGASGYRRLWNESKTQADVDIYYADFLAEYVV